MVRVGGNGENNKESEETPNTTRQSILKLGSTRHSPPCSGLRGTEVASAERGEEEEGEGKEKGPGGNKDVSVSLPGT